MTESIRKNNIPDFCLWWTRYRWYGNIEI